MDSLLSRRTTVLHTLFIIIFIFLKLGYGEILDCYDQTLTSEGNELFLNLQKPEPDLNNLESFDQTVWFKPSEMIRNEKIIVRYKEMASPDKNYELVLQHKGKTVQYSFIDKSVEVMEGRIPIEWLNTQNWMSFSLRNSGFNLRFRIGEQTLDINLDGYEIDVVDVVTLSSDKDLMASQNCSKHQEPSTTIETTTLPPTTTIVTTSFDYETNATEETEYFTETSGANATEDPLLFITPNAVREQDCVIPIWVWVCLCIAAVFIILSVIFLVYICILRRRVRKLELSSSPRNDFLPGGYGQQARDLEFFKPGNTESILGIAPMPSSVSYTQTLKLPVGDPAVPQVFFNTAPRPSEYRRSTSCPDRTPSINFPAPPSTPPPERQESIPLFCPNGSVDEDRPYNRGIRTDRSSTNRRKKKHSKECFDADDEISDN